MEDLPGSSLRTLRRGANLCPGNANSMIALESAEWLDIQRNFFVLDKAKALPIRIGSQTAWDAVRLDFIDNKEKVITKDYELHGRCDFLVLCTVILHFSQSPIATIVVQSTPDNSNLQGKSKKVRVIGSSSCRELEENSRE